MHSQDVRGPAGCERRGENLPRHVCPHDRPPAQRLRGPGVPKAALPATVSTALVLTLDFNSRVPGHSLESCDRDLSPGDKDGILLSKEWDSFVDAWFALQSEGAMH